jgi:hypothetical protein
MSFATTFFAKVISHPFRRSSFSRRARLGIAASRGNGVNFGNTTQIQKDRPFWGGLSVWPGRLS